MKNLPVSENSVINSMDLLTKEAYITALEALTDDSHSLPEDLENLFKHIAQTGDTIVTWDKLKKAFVYKLKLVVDDFNSTNPYIAGKINANCENEPFAEMRESLITLANSFEHPPFTFQRICELVINPKKNYTKCEKFMRALEKNLRVVTAWSYTPRRVSEPGSTEPQMNGSSNSSNDFIINKSSTGHSPIPSISKTTMESVKVNPTTHQTNNHVKNEDTSERMIELPVDDIEKSSKEPADEAVAISKINLSNSSEESNLKVESAEDGNVDATPDITNNDSICASSSSNDDIQNKETGDGMVTYKAASLLPDAEFTPSSVTDKLEKTALVGSSSLDTTQVKVDNIDDKLDHEKLAMTDADTQASSKSAQSQPSFTKRKLDSEDDSDQSKDENNAKRPKND